MEYIEQYAFKNLIGVGINVSLGGRYTHYKCGSCKKFLTTKHIKAALENRTEEWQTMKTLTKIHISCQHCFEVVIDD